MYMSLLIPENDTLVAFYLLPLVGFNFESFGKKYIRTTLSRSGEFIYVELKSTLETPHYELSDNFECTANIDGKIYAAFRIPSEFKYDIDHFKQGLYSKMRESTKKIIYSKSGLLYNKRKGEHYVSHPILQALTKTKALKKYLMDTLKVKTLSDTDEFIDAPSEDWFFN